jgi:hypothetical protein
MSLMKDNVIPGNYGKVFGTNATTEKDLVLIKEKLSTLKGVKDVELHLDIFPKEFTVHTYDMVKVEDIESEVISLGFHAIPKTLI